MIIDGISGELSIITILNVLLILANGAVHNYRLHPGCPLHLAIAMRRRAIKDIMKSQGIADFRSPPPIPTFIDTTEALDELPSYDSSSFAPWRYGGTGFEPAPDDF